MPSSSRYVVRAAPDADGHEPYAFLGGERGETVDVLDEARGFSSRLAAERAVETLAELRTGGFDPLAWRPVRREDVVERPRPFQAPFDLAITDPLAAVQLLAELHWGYCDRVEAWLQRAGIPPGSRGRPTPKATVTAPKWAGVYCSREHECHYPVAYVMMAKDYATIVAHEVVHAYQRLFGRGVGHGADFYGMMEHAAGIKITTHTHSYDPSEAKRLSESLMPWWLAAATRGLLASLPMEVETKKIKRRGVRCTNEPKQN